MLVVVLAVVLLLSTRAWEKVMPAAAEVNEPASALGTISDHGQSQAADEVRQMPGLSETRQAADAHTRQVDETLAEID